MSRAPAVSRVARASAGLLATAALVACHDVVARPRPPLDGLVGAVLVATRTNADTGQLSLLEARAFDPRRADRASFTLPVDADGMVVLGFSCPIERLGLTLGDVALEPLSEGSPPRLPPPAVALRGAIDGADEAWAPLELDAPVVAAIRARVANADGSLCASTGVRYAPEPIELPDEALGLPLALFRLDEARAIALVTSTATRAPTSAYVLSPGGRAEPLALRGAEDAVAGVVDDAGALWLLRRDGQLARGRPDGDAGFEVVTSTTPFQAIDSALLVHADGGLYVSARRSGDTFELARWTRADGWRRFSTRGAGFPVASFAQTREGLFAAPFEPGILRVSPSGVEPVELNDYISQLEAHETLGLVVATVGGREVIVGRPGAWSALRLPVRAHFARFLVAEGDGFVLGGSPILEVQQSVFLQYQPSTGFCAGFERLTRGFASHALRTAEGVFALSLPDLDAPASAVFLRRVVEATSCSAAP
jgi:hypothetical protein